ncbi:MAG: hypothetical protein AABY22_11200, partial [Nanoarchaeota archaeon]
MEITEDLISKKEYNKKYYLLNREKLLSKKREYYTKNRERILKNHREYDKIYYWTKGKQKIREWQKNKYMDLNIENPNLDYETEQVLLGSLLGDGCLHLNGAKKVEYSEEHSIKQEMYLKYKTGQLGKNFKIFKGLHRKNF